MTQLSKQLDELMDHRFKNLGPFEDFAAQLTKLGVVRFTFDALTNQMLFYTNDQVVHTHTRQELVQSQAEASWTLGKALNIAALEKTILDLDEGRIDAIEFHREMHAAG